MSDARRGRPIATASEMPLLRDRLGIGRRRRTIRRDPDERASLPGLAPRPPHRRHFLMVMTASVSTWNRRKFEYVALPWRITLSGRVGGRRVVR